jgi:fucose permease
MIETAAPPSPQSKAERLPAAIRTRVGLAFFAFILIGAMDAALGVLLPSLRSHYSIDKATVGLLFVSGTFGYLVAAFTSGLLVDKLGLRLFMPLGPIIVVLGAITIAFTPPFPALMGGFLLTGIGVGLIDAGLNSYVAGLPKNTALLNYLHAFYGVGALIGPMLATGVIIYELGWNNLYYVWAGVGLLLTVGMVLSFRDQESPSQLAEQTTGEKEGGNVLAAALRMPVVWVAAFFLLIYVGIEVSLGSWMFSFLTEERHETEVLSGLAVSGYWLGLTVGRFVLGKVSEKLGNRLLIELCLVGVVAGVALVWLVPVGVVMAAGMWLIGFSLGPIFPTTIALMSGLVPARILPSAIGFIASFGSMGAALLPATVGALAEQFGLWVLMPCIIGLTAVLLGLWVALRPAKEAMRETRNVRRET